MIHLNAAAASAGGGLLVGGIILIVLIVVAIVLYWIPAAVAYFRHVPGLGSVVVINALLGWTLIGWVVALAMAMRTAAPQPRAVIYGNGYIQDGSWQSQGRQQAAPGQGSLGPGPSQGGQEPTQQA